MRAWLLVLLACLAGGASADGRHDQGRAIYNLRCYFCHGYSGDARTLAATYLSPPPRDFTASTLTAPAIARTLRSGRAGTAMKSYRGVLSETEIELVAAFVATEFVRDKAPNTAYHTEANGWPRHERYRAAFPYARGEQALDTPVESLSAELRAGRRLFMSSCISCHDRGRVASDGPAWMPRPVSYPRAGFEPGQPAAPTVDAVSSASVYARHDVVPALTGLSAQQRRGESLFQRNCAFCHGADGTGRNWIGQFMEPKARDLTQYTEHTMPRARLLRTIRDGLPGSSMPAWRGVLDARQTEAVAAYVQRAFFGAAATADAR